MLLPYTDFSRVLKSNIRAANSWLFVAGWATVPQHISGLAVHLHFFSSFQFPGNFAERTGENYGSCYTMWFFIPGNEKIPGNDRIIEHPVVEGTWVSHQNNPSNSKKALNNTDTVGCTGKLHVVTWIVSSGDRGSYYFRLRFSPVLFGLVATEPYRCTEFLFQRTNRQLLNSQVVPSSRWVRISWITQL